MMNDYLLLAILIVLILQWLGWGPRTLTDYVGWKRRELYRWNNARQAKKRKGA